MKNALSLFAASIVAVLIVSRQPAPAGFEGGRAMDPGKTFAIRVSVGQLDNISGQVEETKRAGADALDGGSDFAKRLLRSAL